MRLYEASEGSSADALMGTRALRVLVLFKNRGVLRPRVGTRPARVTRRRLFLSLIGEDLASEFLAWTASPTAGDNERVFESSPPPLAVLSDPSPTRLEPVGSDGPAALEVLLLSLEVALVEAESEGPDRVILAISRLGVLVLISPK